MAVNIISLLTAPPATGQIVPGAQPPSQPVGKDNPSPDSPAPKTPEAAAPRRQGASASPESQTARPPSRPTRQQVGPRATPAARPATHETDTSAVAPVTTGPVRVDEPAAPSFNQLLQNLLATPAEAPAPVSAQVPLTIPGQDEVPSAPEAVGSSASPTPIWSPEDSSAAWAAAALAVQPSGSGSSAAPAETIPLAPSDVAMPSPVTAASPAPVQLVPAATDEPAQTPAAETLALPSAPAPKLNPPGAPATAAPAPASPATSVPAPTGGAEASLPAQPPPAPADDATQAPAQDSSSTQVSVQASGPAQSQPQAHVLSHARPASNVTVDRIALAAAPIPAVPPVQQTAPPASSSADQAQAPTGDTTAATVAVRTATKAAGPRVSGPVAQTASSQPASVSPAVRPARDTAWASRNARVAGASESADQAQPSPGSMAAGVSAFLRASDQGAAPAPAGTAAPEAAQTTRAMIADQVVSVVLSNRSDHSQQVTIRLDPPELGTIHLSLQTDKDMVRGVVRVDNPETFKQLQRETPQLIERLVEGGIQVKHIDVQMNTNGGGTPSGWQGANGGGWEQFAQGRGPAGGGVTTGPVSQAALDSPPQAADAGVFTADSVNLWL